MSQATDLNSTSRRGFLTKGAATVAGVAAVTAISEAVGLPQDESALVKLEEQIFEQYEGACAFDAEIIRLSEIWTAESRRLYKEALLREVETGMYLTPQERWALVTDIAQCKPASGRPAVCREAGGRRETGGRGGIRPVEISNLHTDRRVQLFRCVDTAMQENL